MIREGYFVDREVALEHAPAGAELFDAVRHKAAYGRRQLLGADRFLSQMPIEAGAGHADASELHCDIRACSHGCHASRPRFHLLVVLSSIGTSPNFAPTMVEVSCEFG